MYELSLCYQRAYFWLIWDVVRWILCFILTYRGGVESIRASFRKGIHGGS